MKINGAYIRYYRKRRKLTQEQLANAVGVSWQSISNWERDGPPVKWRHYKKVCEVLEIEQDALLTVEVRTTYSWLLLRFEQVLLEDDTAEIARLSKEVLAWERFFTAGTFFGDEYEDDEVKKSDEVERAIAVLMRGKEE